MTPLYDTQEFYKKMLDLQERLRKSEDERMKLEERFNLLSQDSRNRRESCINTLRMRYIDFLEEQRLRDERNHQILGSLDKIDSSLARMTARTDRLGILRKQYEAYLLRVYANRSSGGGTGDSGVGSHNEDRSPMTNISQTGKNPPLTQRLVTESGGNTPSLIPQTNYPQSYIGASNVSQFNVPRYTSGQDIPQVHVMQAHGDGSTIAQPQRIPQFYGSQDLNMPNTSVSRSQLMPNVPQEFVSPTRSYVDKFLRSHSQSTPSYPQIQHQLHGISNQYLENPRSRNLTGIQEIISSDLQSLPGSQSGGENARALANETFGPYRHSTPLPGYLDYSTRYSRNASVHEPNVDLRYRFTRSDLEDVINRNEQILPKDYLHNPETVKSATHTSKLSSLLENEQRVSDPKSSRGLNDDELDQYINRIRSLHRDNDRSLEVLDNEQNTSGDLLNATLSEDGPDQLTLHSDDRIKPNHTKILSDDMKNVFALADDFVAETGNLADKSPLKSYSSNDRKTHAELVPSPQICNENVVAKAAAAESSDVSPAVLKVDMTSDNLSISVTRDDILSGTASVGVNQIEETSAIANGKFRPKITPPIAGVDTSRLNITDVAKLSQNNLVDSKELAQNELSGNELLSSSSPEYLKMLEKKSNSDKEVRDFAPGETEVLEDIEGHEVSLIEEEQSYDQAIDIVRELQPPSLQHYEKNVVEIREHDEDEESADTRKIIPDSVAESEIHQNEGTALRTNPTPVNTAETSAQGSIANKIYTESNVPDQKYSDAEQEVNKDITYQDNAEPKYEMKPSYEYSTYDHQPGQDLVQEALHTNLDARQRFEQNPEQLYDPGTNEQPNYDTIRTDDQSNRLDQPYMPASDKPYDSNPIYDANQQYETDPSLQYVQEPNPQSAYDPDQHFEDDPNRRYAGDSNEQYAPVSNEQYEVNPNEQYEVDPNEHLISDPNEQYTTGPNDHYVTDPNEHYEIDPNEQYATGPNDQYVTDPNEHYGVDPNGQYANEPNEEYPAGSNEHYATDQNEGYPVDPNEQYGYYQNQPYENDPNATYANSGNEQYGYVDDQGYQHDPNQQYSHDPNQQYEHDPNQQYEHDPNQQYEHDPNQQYEHDPNQQFEQDPSQQYEHDPNESALQDPNQEYKKHEYGQNQSAELVGYEENQHFENESQQHDADDNVQLQSSNQDYPIASTEEQIEIQAAAGDSYIQELSDPDDIRTKEHIADGKKKNKDVIRALLESDTESTIERNPSNNTESDFDFN